MTPEERATKIVEDFREKEVANEGPTHDYCVEAIAAAIREAVREAGKPSTDVHPLNDDEKLELVNLMIMLKDHPAFLCEYRNWRGEVSTRHLVPVRFWYGSTEWHPKPGLMLKAMDVEKKVERDFCVADFNLATLCAAETKCQHQGYSFAKDGRRCPHCLEMLTDFGD